MAKLYFYYGAMGACKSATAITTAYNYVEAEIGNGNAKERSRILRILKPALETRDGDATIRSRIGLEAECETIERFIEEFSVEELGALPEEERRERFPFKVLIVDEAQFCSREQIDYLSDVVDFLDVPVICYGLRADFQNRLFPGSERLMEIADKLEELKTMCWCGRKATCNARYDENGIVREGEQVLLGANNNYKALCRKHYKQGLLFPPKSTKGEF
ncbi:MAG: thymidine kinase [Lachnospiraceae bacterium]